MATYDDWNRKLVDYVTAGSPYGVAIYLSVDKESLNRIGRAKFDLAANVGVDDFSRAVQHRVVSNGKVNLQRIEGRDTEGLPTSVAFLIAMVLAASLMEDAELSSGSVILQTNYFRRLRDVLGLDVQGESGRPRGMEGGAEEALWLDWGRWLQQKGFLPSARRGEGSSKYISYPISQALLREADKHKLRDLFAERNWRQVWDSETLVAHLLKESDKLSQHLRDILRSHDLQYDAAAEDILELYDLWCTEDHRGTPEAEDRSSHLYSGLYRSEESLTRTVEYWLYPRRPRRVEVEHVVASIHGVPIELEGDQQGWYMPAALLEGEELNRGATYPIVVPTSLESLVLPKRRFWILVPDPDDPDSGAYATWGSPPPGTPFILLCHSNLLPQLQQLKEERLIEWSGDPIPRFGGDIWRELQYCMVLSQAWSGIFIDDRELFEALRPSQSLSIGLSGGLRAPGQRGWLEGAGPLVTVFGFPSQAQIQVIRVADDEVIDDQVVSARTPLAVHWPTSGDYRVEASSGNESTARLVKITSWNQLVYAVPRTTEVVDLGAWHLCGAWLQAKTDETV